MSKSMHPGGLRLTDRAARLAGVSSGMSLLDIGCGAGASLEFLARKFGIIPFGMELSKERLNTASEHLPGVTLNIGDAAQIPYGDMCFDAVICECVLSLVEDATQAAHEMHRVLRPDGTLIVSDVCCENDFCEIQAMFTEAGFNVTHFEEHRAALVTYAAEAYISGTSPPSFGATCETSCTAHGRSTYYLLIGRRGE